MSAWGLRRLNTGFAVVLLGLAISRSSHAVSDPHGMLGAGQNQTPAADSDDSPRLSPAELRRLLPDLEAHDSPPPVLIAPQFGMHIPYQVLGVGLGADLYPLQWLRLSALYSFGFSPTNNDVVVSSYAEAAVGVRVFNRPSQTALDLTSRAIAYASPLTLRAFVPSSQALFVEGGAIAGFFSPARCTANCDLTGPGEKTLVADDRQLFLPFAGLRYVYFYQAASQRARFRNRAYLQVFVHAIGRAFNTPDHPIFSWKGETLDRNPI